MDRYPDDGQIPPEFKRHNSSVKRLERIGGRSLNCAQFRTKCRLNSARIVTEQGAPRPDSTPLRFLPQSSAVASVPSSQPVPRLQGSRYRHACIPNDGASCEEGQMSRLQPAPLGRLANILECSRFECVSTHCSTSHTVMQVNLTYANECALLILLRFASSSKRPLSNSPSSLPPRWCREPDHTTTPMAIRKRKTGNSTGIIGTYVQGGGGGVNRTFRTFLVRNPTFLPNSRQSLFQLPTEYMFF